MIPAATRRLVRERAGNRCEYCRLPQEAVPFATFHVEHIVARQHNGGDEPDNLALACHHCNAHKGPNLSGIDPDSGQVVRLFDPRRQAWDDHFRRRDAWILGLTPEGRATVAVLAVNSDLQRRTRADWEQDLKPNEIEP
jgi:5-methylcytosine-specific restriction endonuclease McrA